MNQFERMWLADKEETRKANQRQLYGSIASGIGQGLLADRTAKNTAGSERDLLERKAQLEQEAHDRNYNPADFQKFGAEASQNFQPLGYTQVTNVGNMQTANDEVAQRLAKQKDTIAKMQQQRGRAY